MQWPTSLRRSLAASVRAHPRRWAGGALATVLLLVVAGLLAIGWVGSERGIHPKVPADEPTLAEHPLPAQDVRFASRDGTRLDGWWVPGAPRAGTVVLLAGYGGTRLGMLPQAEYLHAAGYNVLLFDFRGRGQSGGSEVTFGAFEQGDALGALDYLAGRGDVDMQRVGLQGASMGGAVAIMAGAADRRVAGVVSEAPFKDVPSIINTEFERRIGLPRFPFAPITVFILERRLGVRAADISPLRALPGLAGRPLLLIEDADDPEITPDNQRDLYAAARAPKELWRVEGAGHAKGHDVAKAEYERRVLAFWAATFAR